jgi:hypothetical protein
MMQRNRRVIAEVLDEESCAHSNTGEAVDMPNGVVYTICSDCEEVLTVVEY